jgi:zinc and cadmium transporter
MISTIYYPIIATLLLSLVSLVGIFTIPFEKFKQTIPLLVAFAAGSMIGDVFLHLLPNSVEENVKNNNSINFIWIIVGITMFYLLETALHWHHDHEVDDSHASHNIGNIALAGDVLHNFFDGLGIAAAFAINPTVGIATTIAFIAHEIPHELGTYAVFISSGWNRKKALIINFCSAFASVFGAIIGTTLIAYTRVFEQPILMITAGSLIYIALADLIPESNKTNMHHHKTFRFATFASFIIGVAVMYSLIFLEMKLGI